MAKTLKIVIIALILVITAVVAVRIYARSATARDITNRGRAFPVRYVPKEAIFPAYGYNGSGMAIVREDLPPRIKNFVLAHERFHLQYTDKWFGWLGRELRANFFAGLSDPMGFAATAWSSVTDTDRINFYLERVQLGR